MKSKRGMVWMCAGALAFSGCEQVQDAAVKLGEQAPHVSELKAAEFDDFVETPGRVAVIAYHAEWCGPCKMLAPVLASVSQEFGGLVVVGRVNVDREPTLAQRAGARSIPDVRIYRDGVLVDQFVGYLPADELRPRLAAATAGLEVGATGQPAEPPIQPMSKDWLPPGLEQR